MVYAEKGRPMERDAEVAALIALYAALTEEPVDAVSAETVFPYVNPRVPLAHLRRLLEALRRAGFAEVNADSGKFTLTALGVAVAQDPEKHRLENVAHLAAAGWPGLRSFLLKFGTANLDLYFTNSGLTKEDARYVAHYIYEIGVVDKDTGKLTDLGERVVQLPARRER